jgi:hypothetical protein
MNRHAIRALRALILFFGLMAVFGQTVIVPISAVSMSRTFPEFAFIAVPFTIIAIATLACIQVALVAVWALLAMVQRGSIFTGRAFRWVDVIIGASLAATALILAAAIGTLQTGPPGLMLALSGVALVGGAIALLLLVMRGLLRTATALEGELAEVV